MFPTNEDHAKVRDVSLFLIAFLSIIETILGFLGYRLIKFKSKKR